MIKATLKTLAASMLVMSTNAMAASVCVDFTQFCDGLELNINGGQISGTWQAYNCSPGADTAVFGNVKNGEGRVFCSGSQGCAVSAYFSSNFDFAFFIDPAGSVFDLYGRDGGGNILTFQVNSPFTLVGVPCPFANDRSGVSTVGLTL